MLDQAIVTASGTNRALGSQIVGYPFEYGLVVIVQAAHQPGIDHVALPRRIQQLAQPREVVLRFRVQVIRQRRRAVQQRLGLRVLAVEDTQRVALQAPLAVFIQFFPARLQIGHQRRAIGLARRAAANGIELQGHAAGQAQLAPDAGAEQDDFGIHVRAGNAKGLHTDLVKLPLAALLRALVAKHRARVPQPPGYAQQVLLDRRAHATGGPLRAQGETVAVAILETVHFLLDNVGDLADGALEQPRGFHQWQAYLPVAVSAQHATHGLLQVLPVGCLIRQDIVHPADCSDVAHCFSRVDYWLRPAISG